MRRKRKNSAGNRSLWAGTSIGIMISAVISICAAILLAMLVLNGYISDDAMNHLSVAIQILSAFIGALLAGKIVNDNKFVATLASGLGYLLLLFAVTFLFFDGLFVGVLMSVIGVLVATAFAILLVIKAKRSPHARKTKAYFR